MNYKTRDNLTLITISIILLISIIAPIWFVIYISTEKNTNLVTADLSITEDTYVPQVAKEVEEKKDVPTELPKPKEQAQEILDTMDPQELFYKKSLSVTEKSVYAEICRNVVKHNEKTFNIHEVTVESFKKIFKYITYDHEEFFWFENIAYNINENGYVVSAKLNYNCSKEQRATKQQQIDASANEILANINETMTSYDKAKYIHDKLILNTAYNSASTDNQNIYSVLVGKQSVCAGYARAYQYLLKKANVFCTYITGEAIDETGTTVGHAWNLINIGTDYYYVDITFDDPMQTNDAININYISHIYFGITTEELLKTHSINKDINSLPIASSNDYNYYVKEGMFFNTYTNETLTSMFNTFKSGNASKEQFFAFKFANKETYVAAINGLFKVDKSINSILKKVNKDHSCKNKIIDNTISYMLDDKKYIISFILDYK
ncbi:MAG: transglutaminase domain-containing protein [Clostridia bacterium]